MSSTRSECGYRVMPLILWVKHMRNLNTKVSCILIYPLWLRAVRFDAVLISLVLTRNWLGFDRALKVTLISGYYCATPQANYIALHPQHASEHFKDSNQSPCRVHYDKHPYSWPIVRCFVQASCELWDKRTNNSDCAIRILDMHFCTFVPLLFAFKRFLLIEMVNHQSIDDEEHP